MDIDKEVKSIFSKYFDRETKLLTKRDICEMLGVSLGKVDIMNGSRYIL
jgi:DNA-binding FadR family transcriptional regulator